MPGQAIGVVVLLAVGIPASVVRLWLLWWRGVCTSCARQRSACVCGPGGPTMRPRR